MDFSTEYSAVSDSVIRVLAIAGLGTVTQQVLSSGSGVLIGDGTRALTCSHCIKPNSTSVGALSGQNNGQIATVIFNDPNLDIAIIEFQNPINPGVTIGDSDNVNIGQEAFVVGFPSHTTEITALSANIAGFENHNGNRLIKIDSSVNHGNSGGPLFNANGELIGIVNAKFGNLSNFLNQVQQANPQASMSIGGINPVQVIQQLIGEMKKNLNLGMGSAIPIRIIGNATNLVGDLIT